MVLHKRLLRRAWMTYHNGTHHAIIVRTFSSHAQRDEEVLFNYTSGRWLWNEKAQLAARRVSFNVSELQIAACRAVGTSKCLSIAKIGEGNYNKAYRLEMDNGLSVIAKIPHANAGPRILTTASEVATMDLVRTVLGLPVPKVLAWSADDRTSVGAEYVIMEEAQGSQLHEVWQDLPLRVKREIVEQFVEIESKLLSLSFDRFGSICFKDSGVAQCEPAIVTNAPQDVVDRVRSHYCIGPITQREFWEKERSKMQHHGPWMSSTEYLKSIASREIEWINSYAKSHEAIKRPFQYVSPSQDDPKAHTSLLEKFISVIPDIIPKDPDLVSSRFWHPDFHAGNIYIDSDYRISSIIDWQGAWTTPPFLGAKPPLLLDYSVEIRMFLPDNFKTLDDATKDQLRYQVAQSILIHAYETSTAEQNPLMYKMMRYPYSQTLKQLEAFAGGTWDDCLAPFENCLMTVEKDWEHFNTDKPCPYHFTQEEVQQHYEDAELFNKSQDLWGNLQGVLTDEGYTNAETYEQAVKVVKGLRAEGLNVMQGEERKEFDKETRWVTYLT